MVKDRIDIEQLITNRLLGTISEEENLFLDDWIGQSIENRRLYSEQKILWDLFEIHQKVQKIDAHKAYQKISNQLFLRNLLS